MTLIYVAGPYNAPDTLGIQQNILNASRVAIACWRKGWSVICPHKNTAGFEAFESTPVGRGFSTSSVRNNEAAEAFEVGGLTWETWMRGDLEMLSKCEAIVMVPGWEASKGSKIELEYAKKNGMKIYYSAEEVPTVG